MKKFFILLTVISLAGIMVAGCKKHESSDNPDNPWSSAERRYFTINSQGGRVKFAMGNLQYHLGDHVWRFAEHQYDVVGSPSQFANTTEPEFTYPGNVVGGDNADVALLGTSSWIDLFGWSTPDTYFGVSVSNLYSDYGGDFLDWGPLVSNDSLKWRTLTSKEWDYLLYDREAAESKVALGRIMLEGQYVNGCILLPDDWRKPASVAFTPGVADSLGDYSLNTYSLTEWDKMEANGAVFLPASGFRNAGDLFRVGSEGRYWSATTYYIYDAYDFVITNNFVFADTFVSRDKGMCVRLVRNLNF